MILSTVLYFVIFSPQTSTFRSHSRDVLVEEKGRRKLTEKQQENSTEKWQERQGNCTRDEEEKEETFMRLMEERHKERIEQLRAVCGGRQNSLSAMRSPMQSYQGTSLYVKQFKYTICRIEKVASSNWLEAALLMSELFTFDDLHAKRVRGDSVIILANKRLAINSIREIKARREAWESSLNIITVRHPFMRVISAFRDKMDPEQKSWFYRPFARRIEAAFRQRRHRAKDRNLPLTGVPTFEDFVNFLTSDPNFERFNDGHWKSFDRLCKPCASRYDVIVKMETIDDDMRYLQRKLHVTTPYEVFFRSSLRKKYDACEAYASLPPHLITKLYQRYKTDFQLFGYSWPAWLDCIPIPHI